LVIWYPSTLTRYWQSVLFFPVGVYILLALGLNIVVGQTGLLDLGYVAFFAVGAYTTAKRTAGNGHFTAWEALLLAIVVAMAAGVTLGGPTLRLRGDYLAIVTLGFGEIVRIIAQNSNSLGEAQGITGIPHPTRLPGLNFTTEPLPYFYLVLACIIVAILLVARLKRSRVGRAWNAMREDEDVAQATGVNTTNYKLLAFALGASVGCLGGAVFVTHLASVFPGTFSILVSITALSIIILGGMGSIPGVVVGSLALIGLPELLREFAEFKLLVYGGVLVIMMLARPEGLVPDVTRRRELHEVEGEPEPVEDSLAPAEPV
jgi:branched-chain amino acid transport system permease protein